MELEVTWKRAIRVWWAYLWRHVLAVVGATFVGAIVGGIIGFVMGLAGFPTDKIKLIVTPIGIFIGLAISVIPIKMILGKNFGEFRIALVTNTDSNP